MTKKEGIDCPINRLVFPMVWLPDSSGSVIIFINSPINWTTTLIRYRASRICRVLGNPTAYEILYLLRNNMMRPEEIAETLGLSISTVSLTLRSLRQIDLVRYVVKWKKRIYWIKDDKVLTVLSELEKLVRRIKFREY